MQIRCTKKLQKALGIKDADLAEIKKADTSLGDWYANVFMLDRRKCIIFMNERTLLSFIIFGVRKDNAKNFEHIFVNGVARVLAMEDIGENAIVKVMEEYQAIEYTKTDNKSLLGNMNDLVHLYTHTILSDGGIAHADLTDIIHKMNRMPQRNIGWGRSIDAVRELLSSNAQ